MPKKHHVPWTKLATSLCALAALVTIIATFWRSNSVVFVVLAIITIAMFLQSKRRSTEAIAYLVGAVFGPTMEMIIIHFGAWQYTNPTLGGVPLWLPLLWGLTSVSLMKITRWLTPV